MARGLVRVGPWSTHEIRKKTIPRATTLSGEEEEGPTSGSRRPSEDSSLAIQARALPLSVYGARQSQFFELATPRSLRCPFRIYQEHGLQCRLPR